MSMTPRDITEARDFTENGKMEMEKAEKLEREKNEKIEKEKLEKEKMEKMEKRRKYRGHSGETEGTV